MAKQIRLGTYPYTYLRTIVMKKKLLSRDDYDKILKMTPEEIANFIEDLEYKEDVAALGVRYSGTELVERALQKNLSKDFEKLLRISPKELQDLITLYQKRYDIYNIKTIMRGKFSGLSNEDMESHINPVSVENKEFFDRLMNAQTVEDVVSAIPFLKEADTRKALDEFRNTNSLVHLENLLDKYYYSHVISSIASLREQGKLYKKFLLLEIDVMNVKLILKSKYDGVDDKSIADLIFSYGTIKKSTIDSLLKAEKDTVLKELEKTGLKDAVVDQPGDASLSDLELAFDVVLLKEARKLITQSPLSVDTIIGYMFLKDIEVKNLSRIVKAKQFKLSDEFIEKAVVI